MNSNTQPTQQATETLRRPDEQSGFTVEGVVKIYDPQTQKVFVEKRI